MAEGKSWRPALAALLLCVAPLGPIPLRAQDDPSAGPAAAGPINARINLTITPKRLTFNRTTRSATVYIFNQGNARASVDVTFIDRVMLPDGEIQTFDAVSADAATKPVADRLYSARRLVAATPRRITLAPGRGQTVRLRVTPPANPEAAEYRSHLTVSTVPPREAGLAVEDAAAGREGEFSIQLNAVFGLSIPVIIRTGTPDVRADIRNVRLDHETTSSANGAAPGRTAVVTFDLARVGANSLFGNLEIRSASGGSEPIGFVRGVGVYPEVDSRSIRIPLQREPAAGEVLDVRFVDDDLSPGQVIARTSLTSP
jgi:hypothetical protein